MKDRIFEIRQAFADLMEYGQINGSENKRIERELVLLLMEAAVGVSAIRFEDWKIQSKKVIAEWLLHNCHSEGSNV